MTDARAPNPLTAGVPPTLVPQPCSLVVFGGAGDLSRRKLLPAVYNLMLDGVLPASFATVGFSREEMSDDQYRALVREGVEKFSRRPVEASRWGDFERSLFYQRGVFGEAASFAALKRRLEEVEAKCGIPG